MLDTVLYWFPPACALLVIALLFRRSPAERAADQLLDDWCAREQEHERDPRH